MRLPVLGQTKGADFPERERQYFPEYSLAIRAVHLVGPGARQAALVFREERTVFDWNFSEAQLSPEALQARCDKEPRVPLLLGPDGYGFLPRCRVQLGQTTPLLAREVQLDLYLPRFRRKALFAVLRSLDEQR